METKSRVILKKLCMSWIPTRFCDEDGLSRINLCGQCNIKASLPDNNLLPTTKHAAYTRGRKSIIVTFLMSVIIEIRYKCHWNKTRREFIDLHIKKIKFSKKISLMVTHTCICIIVACVEKINPHSSSNDFHIRTKEEESNTILQIADNLIAMRSK